MLLLDCFLFFLAVEQLKHEEETNLEIKNIPNNFQSMIQYFEWWLVKYNQKVLLNNFKKLIIGSERTNKIESKIHMQKLRMKLIIIRF